MNDKQLKWVRSHDWFISKFLDEKNILSVIVWQEESKDCKVFTDIRKLKDWAGY